MKSQPARELHRQRNKVYQELSQLIMKLTLPSLIPLSQNQLQTLLIQCSTMTLRPEEESGPGPLFCNLLPSSTMDEAFDKSITEEDTAHWPGYSPTLCSNFYAAFAIARTLQGYTWELPLCTEWRETGLVLTLTYLNEPDPILT